jgi:F-type H+-transporting ATPase subunit a
MHEVSTELHPESFFQIHEPMPTIAAPVLGDVGPFTVATSSITILLITLIVIALVSVASKSKLVPGKMQHLFEMFYEQVSAFIAGIVGSKKKAAKVIPYVGALMMYLLIANLLPMMPGISGFYVSINGEHVPLFRGATTDFNTTFGLAFAVIITMQLVGMKEQGVFGYLSHFIQIKQVYKGFRKSAGEGFVSVVGFLVGLIEIISEFAKMLSLSLRLFGNLFAHEVLTVILLGSFAYVVPAVWMGMGFLVGVVQSVVFVSLVTVYYSLVLKKEGKDHH